MLSKGNSLCNRRPLNTEQRRLEQNWALSSKPHSVSLSQAHTLVSSAFVAPAHGTWSVNVPKHPLMPLLMALDCTELMLFILVACSWPICSSAQWWLCKGLSSGSPDRVWPAQTQLFSTCPWEHPVLEPSTPCCTPMTAALLAKGLFGFAASLPEKKVEVDCMDMKPTYLCLYQY